MAILILAEKPSMARAIGEALGDCIKKDGYLEAGKYKVTWAYGHLVMLAEPEGYGLEYKQWRLSKLPISPEVWKTRPRDADAANQLKLIAALAKDAEYLVNACDAAREGELIFRYITEFLHLDNKPVRRLWVSSLTPAAIQRAFQEMKSGDEYNNLYASALVRARGDWLIGMNSTRVFTLKYREVLGGVASIGRVQTPTLAMLVRREREVRAFTPEQYWEVLAGMLHTGSAFQAKWHDSKGNSRISDGDRASEITARVKQTGKAMVVESKSEESKHAPPLLYDLTSLQREANKRYGLTASQTLAAAQNLYERKMVTYPRTDSRYVSEDMADKFPALLKRLVTLPAYIQLADKTSSARALNRRVVDNAKVTDHHAILPTGSQPAKLGAHETKIYDLIARRFLANCMPFAEENKVTLQLKADGEWFVATGTTEVKPGWREAERTASKAKEDAEEANPVPVLPVDAMVSIARVDAKERSTKPPSRFTEGSLLGAMEHAGREIDDEGLREVMKGKGIGTPATRASIIERLKEVGYIVVQKKTLSPTEKGERIIDLVERSQVDILASPELTGEWESRLNKVAEGEENAGALENYLRQFTKEMVERVRGTDAPTTFMNSCNLPQCPLCKGELKTTYRTVYCATTGCTLRFSRQVLRYTLAPSEVEALLRNGRTSLIKGLYSPRTNKPFSAVLILKQDGSGVDFSFDEVKSKRSRPKRTTPKQGG